MLAPSTLGGKLNRISSIPHVDILRLHTRIPVVAPERITDKMVEELKAHTPTYIVLHTNHPSEMTPEAKTAIARLVDNGIPMLSQSVLLKEINDDVDTFKALMKTLVKQRVKPYYVHHPDWVMGSKHFRVSY